MKSLREHFEDWLIQDYKEADLSKTLGGSYRSTTVEAQWRAFAGGVALEKGAPEQEPDYPFHLALDTLHPSCHKAADAFWAYWKANGETHKHGYYESTWGAINQAIRLIGVREHHFRLAAPEKGKP